MTLTIKKELTEFVRPSEHSTYSPSSVDRWTSCHYSVKASSGIPSESSKYAAEGTLAHRVCEEFLRQECWGIPMPDTTHLEMAVLEDGGDDMLEGARIYADAVLAWLSNKDLIGDVLWYGMEKGIPIIASMGCFGTADFVIVGTKGTVVLDYKYGKGKAVGARSPQLLAYLAGVNAHLIGVPANYRYFSVVVQPRLDPYPKEHMYEVHEVAKAWEDIYHAIVKSHEPNLQPVEGNHCFWCPARRTNDPAKKCPAILQKAVDVANENFEQFFADMKAPVESVNAPNPKRDAALIRVMSLLPLMKQIAEEAESEFQHRLEKGEVIDGLVLAEKLSNRKLVSDDVEEMTAKIKAIYPDLYPVKVSVKLKTITEMEKELGKKVKLDPSLTQQTINRKVVLQDAKVRQALDALSSFAAMINQDSGN